MKKDRNDIKPSKMKPINSNDFNYRGYCWGLGRCMISLAKFKSLEEDLRKLTLTGFEKNDQQLLHLGHV